MSDAPIRAHYRSIAPKRVHYHEVDMQNIVLSMFSCGAGTGVFMGRRARSLNVSFAHNGKIIWTPG
tara:strand:- start:732 stop:929 length:198 start_codon:yes stop_codon:yes gene_type:complete